MVGIDTNIFTIIPDERSVVISGNKGTVFHRSCELSVGRFVLIKRVNADIRTEGFSVREKTAVI